MAGSRRSATRSASCSTARTSRWPTSRRTRRCSITCGCAARCAAPRKAARKAIAAPARCWSAGSSDGELVYESVNACIRFIGSLDGCHVVTVEHLGGEDGRLHPVQQAMVDFHGSQCGFCTPGFVMSLYALWMRVAASRPMPRSRRRCRAISAAAPATRRSCAPHARFPATARPARDPLAAERADDRGDGSPRMRDGARVEIGEGKQRLVVPADRRRFRRDSRRRARAPRSSPARPMSGSG